MSSLILERDSQTDLDLLLHSPGDHFWSKVVQGSKLVIFPPEAPCVSVGFFLVHGKLSERGNLRLFRHVGIPQAEEDAPLNDLEDCVLSSVFIL